ncbi:MAG: hypothetical protein ACLFQS_01620 [Bacteroidales bacterium]
MLRFFFALFLVFLISCQEPSGDFNYTDTSRVEFREHNGNWSLYRNNEPYFIKGAHGTVRLDWLQEIGGNSIIIYESELNDSIMDLADSLGLTVSISLEIGKVRFEDYTDNDFIAAQRNRVKKVVEKYHEHPALLFWIVGNELHIENKNNIALWREVNEISEMIHSIDPYHPTTTTIASFPTVSFQPLQVKLFAPDLDFITLTIYEFAPRIRRESDSFVWGINGPFLVSEWGGQPYWMFPRTEWDAILEHSSTKNADFFYHNHYLIFDHNPEKCIGGYVFYWGQKQERTHTVFSLIHDEKYKTQSFESLQYLWTETFPENWCPRIDTFYIEGFSDPNVYLRIGDNYTAKILASDPDMDSLTMKWELRTEGYYRDKTGGEPEMITEIVFQSDSIKPFKERFSFSSPDQEGPFRLFVYVYDGNDYVATANRPVYVLP